MKINITYIISNIDKSFSFEWLAKYLNKENFNLHFILLNPGDSALERYLIHNNISCSRVIYNGKKDLLKTFYQIFKILKRKKAEIVHTHLFDASLIGLSAAKLAGVKRRIHTRHHSDSNKVYSPNAVKYDRMINRLSTDIIAISKNVANVLINDESVPKIKIYIIYHGLDFNEFENISTERISKLKQKYALKEKDRPVIGVISRYIYLKGIQYIIPAFKKLLITYPNAFLILANTKGNYSKEIKEMLKVIPTANYLEIDFEEDLFALYQLFDIFLHVPIDKQCEAFGQTYIEAPASGVPSVFTLSGIATEFIEDGKNALIAEYKNTESIFEKMVVLLRNNELCKKLSKNGKSDVKSRFNIIETIKQHEQLYLSK